MPLSMPTGSPGCGDARSCKRSSSDCWLGTTRKPRCAPRSLRPTGGNSLPMCSTSILHRSSRCPDRRSPTLQAPEGTLAERVASWRSRVGEVDKQLAENQREIDDIAFRLHGIEGVDRRAIEEGVATAAPSDEETEESEDDS